MKLIMNGSDGTGENTESGVSLWILLKKRKKIDVKLFSK